MTTSSSEITTIPRIGMLATIRNRRGIITDVNPYDSKEEGRYHLVRIEYTDSEAPINDSVIWEREPIAALSEPNALPRVNSDPPMKPEEYDALIRASRWSALTPMLDPDGSGELAALPVVSPFFGAIQVEDFQLVPLVQALKMPRISLLLADDVGLGKTIEAGLVLSELLIRRRIRKVLIMTPGSLKNQWQDEMMNKFSLNFDIIDRTETHEFQKHLGLDANPWRTLNRIITSYHYMRQPDILEQFLTTCRIEAQRGYHAQLPWDLLIVDEAHNLMPSNFGDDSQLTKMLRVISPYFEHKLFLTATPHNGHTRCFSGLLELLDPVRFSKKNSFTPEERKRVSDIMIRRLKTDVNELDDRLERPRRFAERFLEPLPLFFTKKEIELSQAVERFRSRVKSLLPAFGDVNHIAGTFAIEVLNKRLLSCPYAFADSWFRLKMGIGEEASIDAKEVTAAKKASEEDIDNDKERESRNRYAMNTIGAWLIPYLDKLEDNIAEIDKALELLELQLEGDTISNPLADSRYERLIKLINEEIYLGKKWSNNERLIVFTEYKTTLDYLIKRIREDYNDNGAVIRELYGGMDATERKEVNIAFNDPDDPVRILVATDTASEGLNLQETARYLLHYEVPWNPMRLEQRNGRLDRHGQARDVKVFHFTSDDNADLKFLEYVISKIHTIREDLGIMGEVFDAAFQLRFLELEEVDSVINRLGSAVDKEKEKVEIGSTIPEYSVNENDLLKFCKEIDLTPDTLLKTISIAMKQGGKKGAITGPDERGRMRLNPNQIPSSWEPVIDDSLRISKKDSSRGPLPGIVFDPAFFIDDKSGRPVFRPLKDTVLLHLGHPLFRQTLSLLARLRFPSGREEQSTRWTVKRGTIQDGDVVIYLNLEELAVNELREPVHHWIRTVRLPVKGGKLLEELEHEQPGSDVAIVDIPSKELTEKSRDLWLDVETDVMDYISSYKDKLSKNLISILTDTEQKETQNLKTLYDKRIKEVKTLIKDTSIEKLEKERDKLIEEMEQMLLYKSEEIERKTKLLNIEDELARRKDQYGGVLTILERERERVINNVIPRKFKLRGENVQVFPIAVEFRFPES